jgi:hypothetical protein
MVRVLIGIRDDVPLPAICIENADPGQRCYRVRETSVSAQTSLPVFSKKSGFAIFSYCRHSRQSAHAPGQPGR